MKRIVLFHALALGLPLLHLAFWPVPIEPVSWQAPVTPGYTGVHAPNQRLAAVQVLPLGKESQPEHITQAPDGRLYAAVARGRILRLQADGTGPEVFADTGGRALGMAFDAQGQLIVADAHKGLLSVAPDGQVQRLTDQVGGDPIRYADAVAVAANGTIYFTDASTRFAAADGVVGSDDADMALLDILENSATGRVLAYDPATRATRIVVQGLSFANGLVLSQDQRHLFVAETGRYRVWKIDVAAADLAVGSGSPLAQVLLDNLPGFPDNLTRGREGKLWLGLPAPRIPGLDQVADKPWLRKVVLRLSKLFAPPPERYGHAIAFTEDGRVVADLQDPSGAFPKVTGITETADRLYVHTLNPRGLAWLAR